MCSSDLEPQNGGCFYWDAGLFCPAKTFGRGATLNSTFTGSLGNSAAASAMTLMLSADGRYEMSRSGSVQTSGANAGSSGKESGRYVLAGSTLRLMPSAGGSPSVHTIIPVDDGSKGPAPRRLYVGGFMLRNQQN